VKQAELSAKADTIRAETELQKWAAKQEAEIHHKKQLNELEIKKARELSEIESAKFKNIVNSLGANTLKAIAQSGPELQAKLLQGLGLKSFLITDGNSPINLFNTAKGLIGGMGDEQ